MSTDTMEDVTGALESGGSGSQDDGLALVIVWCRDEPERAGELAWIGPDDPRVHVLGRGADGPADPAHVRAALVRQRPGGNLGASPLHARGLSREQLHLRRLDGGRLALDNRGRRALLVGGIPTPSAVVGPGDVVMVEGQLLLLCATRPAVLAPLRHAGGERPPFGGADRAGLVGESPCIWALRDAIAGIAGGEGHTLVHGPAGAGRELVARALHAASPRADRPLVARHVPAIPGELVGIEIFGHEGPAEGGTPGLVEEAEGATLLLEDLGGVADGLASQLGQLMERGEFRRAGDPLPRRADVRVLATVADAPETLPAALGSRFTHALRVPGLAERREDVPLLVRHLLRTGLADHPELRSRFADEDGEPRVAPGFLRQLVEAPPEGGVDALEAELWRAVVVSPGEWIIAPPHAARSASTEAAEGRGADETASVPVEPGEGATRGGSSRLPPGVPESVAEGLPTLSDDERVVLQHLALGRSSGEIGELLFASVRTVLNHRARIGDKLGLRGDGPLRGVAVELARYLGPPGGT